MAEPDPPVPETDSAETSVLLSVLENLDSAVVLADPAGRIKVANRLAGRLLGIPREELAPGRDMWALVARQAPHFAEPEVGRRQLERIRRRDRPAKERVPLADGRIVQLRFTPVAGGDQLWQWRDITERVHGERSIAERAVEVARLAEQRSRFAAAVSHELRTPLTSILGFCELLLDAADEERLRPGQRELVTAIRRNGQRLAHSTDMLLLITRPEAAAGLLRPGPVDFPRLVRDTALDVAELAASAEVWLSVDCSPGPPLLGEERRLAGVVSNLLTNALKFTPEGGRVSVSAAYEEEPERWRLTVADTGRGIPEEELGRVFDSFHRAANSSGASGTGIGLAVVRGTVELHGGTVRLDSVLGEGTTVTVLLPRNGPSGGPSRGPSEGPSEGERAVRR